MPPIKDHVGFKSYCRSAEGKNGVSDSGRFWRSKQCSVVAFFTSLYAGFFR